MNSNNRADHIKASALRWMLRAIFASAIVVALAFLQILRISIAYWVGISLAIFAIGCMATYFVEHNETRDRS